MSAIKAVWLYVAGPMTGLPGFNYAEFNAVTARLRNRRWRVLNPAEIDEMYQVASMHSKPPWEWYMRKALAMVLRADGVATLNGWEQSRGAKLEVKIAHELGVPVRPWDIWASKRPGDPV